MTTADLADQVGDRRESEEDAEAEPVQLRAEELEACPGSDLGVSEAEGKANLGSATLALEMQPCVPV